MSMSLSRSAWFRRLGALASLSLAFSSPAAHAHDPVAPENASPQLPLRDGPPTLKTFVPPPYPEAGRLHDLGGVVTLKIHVDARGKVGDVAVERGIGPGFDEAAVAAAHHLEFHPARASGRDVAADIRFEYRFAPPGHTHTAPTAETAAAVASSELALDLATVDQVSVVDSGARSIDDQRPAAAASARSVGDRDLQLRPIQRPADLFRVTPGLLTVQHAGGGKANQYLLRGFDADHGTDVAFTFDGVPLNLVSHGHGQGYADPNWIIPELVERVDIVKGPYYVEHGDLSSAGAIDLIGRDRGESFVAVGGGSFDSRRAVAIVAPSAGAWHPLLAAEVLQTNGPFQHPEAFRKYNLVGKLSYEIDGRARLSFGATAYAGSWNASGQIPARAVDAGLVDFYGAIDPSEGGASSRENLFVNYRLRPDRDSEFQAMAYLSHCDLTLTSDFTFFSRDPINGDQIQQRDSRLVAGGDVRHRWRRQWRGVQFESQLGGNVRVDGIANGLDHTRARERLAKIVDDDVTESAIGLHAKEEVQLARWLRIMAGVRLDHFTFRVNDQLEDLAQQGNATSGARGAGRISPKAALILSPHASTDLFVNVGRGFHSNDARGVVRAQDPVTPLTATLGYEVGARSRLLGQRLDLAVALWGLQVDSETVWVGDEGTTEAAGATRRLGVELEGRFEILPWLFADLDATWSDARFTTDTGGGHAIPLAPRLTLSGGISALHRSGARGGLRGLHIGQRPATEDGFLAAEAITLVDLFAAYRWNGFGKGFELSVSIENLLERRYKAAQFATVTRLANEPSTSLPPPANACPAGTRSAVDAGTGRFQGCEDLSFSPGNPFALRVMAAYYF
jgi:TonB family protein